MDNLSVPRTVGDRQPKILIFVDLTAIQWNSLSFVEFSFAIHPFSPNKTKICFQNFPFTLKRAECKQRKSKMKHVLRDASVKYKKNNRKERNTEYFDVYKWQTWERRRKIKWKWHRLHIIYGENGTLLLDCLYFVIVLCKRLFFSSSSFHSTLPRV